MSGAETNVDAREVAKFEALAARWWDPQGDLRTLHDINPARLAFVEEHTALAGRRVLDVGCGGGILAEAMAGHGARVTGIDASAAALTVARLHGHESGATVDYERATAEEHAASDPEPYAVVTCMELLEHVPDAGSLVASCARLTAPGGLVVFSTISRTARAWLTAVVGAEYVLGLLPKGTHEYDRLIRPSTLDAWARGAGLVLLDLRGLAYNPLSGAARLTGDVAVNYLAAYRSPERT